MQLVVFTKITCNSLFKSSTCNSLFKISTRENQLATRCLKFQLVKINSQLVVYKWITCNLLFISSTCNLQLATCNLQFTISQKRTPIIKQGLHPRSQSCHQPRGIQNRNPNSKWRTSHVLLDQMMLVVDLNKVWDPMRSRYLLLILLVITLPR